MLGLEIDLNEEPPESVVPIDWDDIAEWDGPAHELDYDMVWDEGNQGDEHEETEVEVDVDALQDLVTGAGDGDHVASGAADEDEGSGSNDKRRKYYPDDLKIAIYIDLLSKTNPPILFHGVSKSVAEKFGVPLRVVQAIWKNGQDGGIQGIVNKYSKNCGRKRVEIDLEAMKNIPLKQRSTFQDLTNALGVKKSTLYNRFKEGYFRRHTNDLKFSLTDENKTRVNIVCP
uniref:DUF7769 domain-containing protein n=1 Tax=Setaria viridis TaxID=4556 RepID=A0A4U6VB18_SETVI|nr:hypothetical protein SEVIR_3G196100v2 [Setaria viridis]